MMVRRLALLATAIALVPVSDSQFTEALVVGRPADVTGAMTHSSTGMVDSLLTVGTRAIVELTEVGEREVVPTDSSDAIMEEAGVEVGQILWQFPKADGEWAPLDVPPPPVVMESEEGWLAISTALDSGHHVVLGLGSGNEPGEYTITFALDLSSAPTFLPAIWNEASTADFRAFLEWEANPYKRLDPEELIVAWNVEANAAPPGDTGVIGPIQLSFQRFVSELRGTVDWMDIPPEERNIADAPPPLLDGLHHVEVWVEVPHAWKSFQNGAICVFTEQWGWDDCFHMQALNSGGNVGGNLLLLDAWTLRENMAIYAMPLDSRWTNRTAVACWCVGTQIGDIPITTSIVTEKVQVTLDPLRPRTSYSQIQQDPTARTLATAKPLLESTLHDLLELEPTVPPDLCPDPTWC